MEQHIEATMLSVVCLYYYFFVVVIPIKELYNYGGKKIQLYFISLYKVRSPYLIIMTWHLNMSYNL